ncbi:MAG: hypothetical protein H5U04_12355 [Firmicutes bacterium]|nr:hypothetical protein [Bacillota bacterium]
MSANVFAPAIESLEELLARCIDLLQTQEEARWELGDLLLLGRQRFGGRGYARTVAGQLGCSTRYIEQLMRTANVFAPEERVADLSWSHHQIAAQTKEPDYWLAQAVDNQWSTRQLRDAIRAAQERGPDRHDAAREADVLIRRVEEYVKRWGRDGEAGLRELWLRVTDVLDRWQKEDARQEAG